MSKPLVKHSNADQKLVAKSFAQGHVNKVMQHKYLRALGGRIKDSGVGLSASTDSKTLTATVNDELVMARSALSSVYGKQPVPFRIPLSQNFSTVSGVANGVASMLISAAPEWSALSALFDEWIPDNGHFDFQGQYSAVSVASALSCALGLAFDPVDAVSITNVREISEHKQHYLYRPVLDVGPTGTVVSTSFRTKAGDNMMRFNYTMKGVEALAVAASGTVQNYGGWRSTAVTGGTANTLIGYAKIYLEAAFPTNGVVVTGIWYHNIRLRSRT